MKDGTKLRIAIAVVLLLIATGWASTWTVRQNEEGVRIRFGKPIGVVGGGLHITLPYPIERIVRVPTSEVRAVAIGVPIGDDAPSLGGSQEQPAQWLTSDTNIVELRANVLYTVIDPVTYLFGLDASDEETGHEPMIRAASEAVLTRLLADTTIDSALATGKIEVSQRGIREIQELLDELQAGVRLSALNIVEVGPPAGVISAFNDVSSAAADRDRLLAEAQGILGTTLPRAQATAREIVQTARALAHTLTSRAQGEADRFQALATEVAVNPLISRERLWLESIERILESTDEKVVPTGSRVYVK